MPKTQTLCPRCHQPVVVDVEQLYDVNTNPQAKQQLLSGNFNVIHCPNCGYEGNLSTPIVYHDPDKELLLTYFPPELGLPLNEQEKMIGPLINRVVNNLPQEKRKAYLLRPQSVLTVQGLVERILEADGITREMVQAQQQRVSLIQRLLSAPEESRAEIVKQEEALIDESFFSILNRLIEAALNGGDEPTARQLASIQQLLLANTAVGKTLKSQAEEAEAAMRSLQEASKKGLTRESLLDLLVEAPTEARLVTLVSMARQGMDYSFFQILSDRINQASGEEKARLIDLREKLLQLTGEIDKALQEQAKQTRDLIETILKSDNIEETTTQYLPAVNQLFVDIASSMLQEARQKSDLDRVNRLTRMMSVIQRASAPPPEYELLETLLSAPDDAARRKMLEEHAQEISPEFVELVGNLAAQTQAQNQDPELTRQLNDVNRQVLRFSMEQNLKK
ncbi:MAG TPA: CpXC domain-containing protein [Anaerolineaceae bacterium]|nr:CpXC domain-containing protein [Anaerolineaceae bacterium]